MLSLALAGGLMSSNGGCASVPEKQDKAEVAAKRETNLAREENKIWCWEKKYGGKNAEGANALQQTEDGGYIVAGFTYSKGAGLKDALVLKLNERGELRWDKVYGGKKDDEAQAIRQTKDKGYIIVGETSSKGSGEDDAWILKLDTQGNVEWERTYGGGRDDRVYSVQQTREGGYIVVGKKKVEDKKWWEAWIFQLDDKGDLEWEKTYGEEEGEEGDTAQDDVLYSVQQTKDSGYVAGGTTWREGKMEEAFLIKLNKKGNKEWDKNFGGRSMDGARAVQQTNDGGYILAGYTTSEKLFQHDILMVKLDKNGNSKWYKTQGTGFKNGANSVQQTADGGFIVAGWRGSLTGNILNQDGLILKLDGQGEREWERIYGSSYYDELKAVQQAKDGGYIAAGVFAGPVQSSHLDAWVLKLDRAGKLCEEMKTYRQQSEDETEENRRARAAKLVEYLQSNRKVEGQRFREERRDDYHMGILGKESRLK